MFGAHNRNVPQRRIEDQIIQQSRREFIPEGSLIMMDTIAGKKIADIIPVLNDGVDAVSPCRRLFVSQPGLEPILRRRAPRRGATLLEGHEVVAFTEDADGITVKARETDTGQVRELRGKYLVGADGAHSKVRELLGIEFDGRGVFSNSITIYFTADLSPWIGGRPISIFYIKNDNLAGFFRMDRECKSGFMVVSTVGYTKLPSAANPASDISEKRLIELLRWGIGVPDIPVKIDGVARWRATSDVARRYQDGRVFLVGDAAHLMPPTGGFGGNTGIHDAHNLAWKLALVLKGMAGPKLLATYEAERKPASKFTVEQAYSRYVTRTAPYLGAKDYQPVAPDFNIELGYLYDSTAVVSDTNDGKSHDDPRARPAGQARAHRICGWRADVQHRLFGKGFVLLAGPQGEAWCDAARAAARKFENLPLEAYCVGSAELTTPTEDCRRLRHRLPVRPCASDGFIARRGKSLEEHPDAILIGALGSVLRGLPSPFGPRTSSPNGDFAVSRHG
jgi:2-polyprenyl-6-methoxyphenol hydroxylase-like FAD-dependent oxidoreductase